MGRFSHRQALAAAATLEELIQPVVNQNAKPAAPIVRSDTTQTPPWRNNFDAASDWNADGVIVRPAFGALSIMSTPAASECLTLADTYPRISLNRQKLRSRNFGWWRTPVPL